MRIVRDPAALPEALAAARREAAGAFGDDTLLVERYFDAPRHIEIQIFGDAHGNTVHCFERECSIQRRYQKIIEEAPSVAVDDALRHRMGQAAVSAGKAIGYVGAGTVEFILDASGAFYFMEVNARLQVEHPVTEAVTGLDLVRLQILVAQGSPLPIAQEELLEAGIDGHAIEARLYAEDPDGDFLPATGTIALWEPALLPDVRYDSGIEPDTEVGVHYDPLLAKVIAHGATRREATRKLVRALRLLGVAGVTTNREFLLAVLTHPAFEAGELDTHFIERHLPPAARRAPRDPEADRLHAIAAAIHGCEGRRGSGPLPPSIPSGWRNNRWGPERISYRIAGEPFEVGYVALGPGRYQVEAGGASSQVFVLDGDTGELALEVDGVRRRFTVAENGGRCFVHSPLGTAELEEIPRFQVSSLEQLAGGCIAPMPGMVRQVRVAVGDRVEEGTVMVVLEAMKMEHELVSHVTGVVKEVRAEVGQMVEPDEVLILVEAEDAASAEREDEAAAAGEGEKG
jgi:acetyl/propionyl-CoA carboxylase alpha subunit